MRLYLNDKERSMRFLALLELLLGKGQDSNKLSLPTITSISEVTKLVDPVQEFLDYYSIAANISISEGRMQWIKNGLYACKGAPSVIEFLDLALGVTIHYEYDFPELEIVEFDQLEVSDPSLFISKFKNLLYSLMYYTDLILAINKLILNIEGTFDEYNYIGIKGFIEQNLELDGNLLDV